MLTGPPVHVYVFAPEPPNITVVLPHTRVLVTLADTTGNGLTDALVIAVLLQLAAETPVSVYWGVDRGSYTY